MVFPDRSIARDPGVFVAFHPSVQTLLAFNKAMEPDCGQYDGSMKRTTMDCLPRALITTAQKLQVSRRNSGSVTSSFKNKHKYLRHKFACPTNLALGLIIAN